MKNINGAKKSSIVVALLSAIFIISMVSPALSTYAYTRPSPPTASYIIGSEDTTTGGYWVGTYGSYMYALPNPKDNFVEDPIGCFCVPCGGYSALAKSPYYWTPSQIQGLASWQHNSPYGDEYKSTSPAVTYSVQGTRTNYVQYPVFEWSWDGFTPAQTDPLNRACWYPSHNAYRLAAWDDGGERGTPIHGYMNFILTFPKGTYKLTVYAYDYEGIWSIYRESELFRIYYGTTLLANHGISQPAFTQGVYESFQITISSTSASITLQVYNDAGHPATNNVMLSGIFVDKM